MSAMDIRQIRYFVAVAEERNIGRAAKRLFISQPPLTRQIQQLEDELQVRLFERTAKGVELTSAGQLFLNESRNILSLIEQAQERTQRAGKGQLGRLDVAIFGSGILNTIPDILKRFKTAYPGVNIVLHQMGKAEQIEALRQKRISVGFNRLLAPLPDIDSTMILQDKLMVAVRDDHPLATKPLINLKELDNEPIVVFPKGARPNFVDLVSRVFQEAGVTMNITQTVIDAVTGIALVSGGFGFCLIPSSASVLQLPGVKYIPLGGLPDNATVDLSCIYLKDDHSPLLSAFLAVVHEYKSQLNHHTSFSAARE